jgi:hypothetical protein
VGLLAVLFARRLALDRSAAREGRRGSGIGQIVLLIFAVVAAYGAIVSDGADARNFAMVALITLGALVVSVRADRNRRGA